MPVTGLSSRRAFLALSTLALRGADNPSTLALLTRFAARLSDNNSTGAIDAFARNMPGYQDVIRNLDALMSQYDVICVIEIREESGDDSHRKADTEWFLEIKSKQDNGPTVRRTTAVQIATQLLGGKWRITSMDPQSLLAPPPIP